MQLLHRTPNPPRPVDLGQRPRICVIKLATTGDLLLTTPALHALRQRYPEATIDVLTTPGSAEILRDSQLVRRIYKLDKYSLDRPTHVLRTARPALAAGRLLTRLRRERYDAAILFHHLTLLAGRAKYQALLTAIAPRLSVGLDNGWGNFFDLRVPDRGFGARHEAEYDLELVRALGAKITHAGHPLHATDLGWDDIQWLPEHTSMGPLVALHPGSGNYSTARRWPAERYAEVATALHEEYGARFLLVGGAEEREIGDTIFRQLEQPDWVEQPATMSPHRLAQWLTQCALFIGNDSFPMHMAALVGTPTVAIFGPSNYHAWGPYRPDAPREVYVVRRNDLLCSPCFYRGHSLGTPAGCPPRSCLTDLGVERVLWPARRLLHQHDWQPSAVALPD